MRTINYTSSIASFLFRLRSNKKPTTNSENESYEITIGERCYNCENYIGLDDLGEKKLCSNCLKNNNT